MHVYGPAIWPRRAVPVGNTCVPRQPHVRVVNLVCWSIMQKLLFACLLLCLPTVTRAQWSVFDPLSEVPPPATDDPQWAAPVDAYVHAQLREAKLAPAPVTSRTAWIRRVSYDLIGLPPAPHDVQAFLADKRPDAAAMEAVVDRLLASPRYGERWGRHWLDVVRYADSDGFAIDAERLSLWRYRDYVIRVFNEDEPFDAFIRNQIAGDELGSGDAGKVAISFYRLGPWEADNMVGPQRWQDYLNDVTSAVGSVFLGLSVGCARCHDHKFDPVLQKDFYQLQAFFAPVKHASFSAGYLPGELNPNIQLRRDKTVGARLDKINALREALRKKIAEARKVPIAEITKEKLDEAIKEKKPPVTEAAVNEIKALESGDSLKPEQRFEARVVAIRNPTEKEKTPDTFILENGDVFSPADKVMPGFLSNLPVWSEELVKQASDSGQASSGRRTLLAQWLTSDANPITPRVLVNRIWNYHFGAGLVATPNDFGINGSGISHRNLLDYLVRQLRSHQWHLKPLHKELVLSRTYRTATLHPEAEHCATVDPDNRLLWRANHRRLESETVRDAILAVSGQLRFEMGGPGYYDKLPAGMATSYFQFTWKEDPEDQRRRRSVYMFVRRNLLLPLLDTFDAADPNQPCEQRSHSVTASQALSLFNGQFANDNSRHMANRLLQEESDEAQRIDRLFWLAVSRAPTEEEKQSCHTFLESKRKAYGVEAQAGQTVDHNQSAWRDLCLAILNTNEFLYLD